MADIHLIASELENEMKLLANEEKSKAMSAYMKGLFPFLGISSPDRKAIQKEWMNTVRKLSSTDKKEIVQVLWSNPYREMHYVALDVINSLPLKEISPEDNTLIEHLILHNSWWDSVDTIAANFTGKYFKKYPEKRDELILKWRTSNNMWLKRTCLLFQLKYGKETDLNLLRSLIIEFLPIKEFFIQKAIGWTLRQYSKTNPDEVRDFLNEIELKGVALKEASKYI